MQTRAEFVQRVRLKKVVDGDSKLLKVYFRKAVRYGDFMDVYEYFKVRITRKNDTRESYEKNFLEDPRPWVVSRARQEIFRIAESNIDSTGKIKPVFFTLTFKDQITYIEENKANDAFKYFCKKWKRRKGYSLQYVVVPERTKANVVHFHGLFFNLPWIPVLELKEIWGNGSIDIQVPKGVKSTTAYISKYISKDIESEKTFNSKRFFCSRGLKRPVDIFDGAVIDFLLDSAYTSTVDSSSGRIYSYKKYKK